MEDLEQAWESMTTQQQEVGRQLEQLMTNYKKDSISRKSRTYLDTKLNQLEELWVNFDAMDKQLQPFAEKFSDHRYFTQSYYLKVSDAFMKTRTNIMQMLENQPSASSQTTPPPAHRIAASLNDKMTIESSKEEPLDHITLKIQGLIRRQRAQTEAIIHLIDGLKAEPELQTRQFYEVKLATLRRYWDDTREINQSIFECSDDVSTYGYNAEAYFQLEDSIQSNIIFLTQCLEKFSSQLSSAAATTTATLQLPKVILPKFDGDYMKWKQFYDLFRQMIHEQPMGSTQKMWYLKNNLSGEAERLIRHLQLSDNNYTVAWNILQSRYNNQRLLVSALMDKLFSQPVLSVESAQAIRRFHDTTNECLLGLANLDIDTTTWDPILIHLLLKRIDKVTHGLYEQSLKEPRECQTIDAFLKFLEIRFQSLEALGNERRQPVQQRVTQSKNSALTSYNKYDATCENCKGNHKIFSCEQLLKLKPSDRLTKIKTLKLCFNCLKDGHSVNQCKSRSCFKCQGRHNTILHIDTAKQYKASPSKDGPEHTVNVCDTSLAAHRSRQSPSSYVLLGTALVTICNEDGTTEVCRAILDSGSQLNFISERMCKKLNIFGSKDSITISGIGSTLTKATRRASIGIKSNNSNYSSRLEAYVIPDISTVQPQIFFEISSWPIPPHIELADPDFNKPRRVDLLIGAELYCELMSVGQIKLDSNLPTMQNTVFGWVILGRATLNRAEAVFCGISNFDLDRRLEQFWTVEESPTSSSRREEFPIELQRNKQGRFEVKLPLCQNPSVLGQSEDLAIKRFLALERKLNKNSDLKRQYTAFLMEYMKLNHMEEISRDIIPKVNYFLPHHCVLKPSSSSTKLRVVFDASAKTSSNLSLNDIMMKGPTIQDDLFSILLRFRTHKFVFSADIEKMYRQVDVCPEDRNLQLIVWRSEMNQPLKYYRLRTVTYGTTAAPYLAIKCLAELAATSKETHPHAASAMNDFYVDDVMTGSNNLNDAIQIQDELRKLLYSAGFILKKWCANHEQLLTKIPKEDTELKFDVETDMEETIKTLGLTWHPRSDHFAITTSSVQLKDITKRTVSADIARLFDPLGLMSPIIVAAKIFLQQLWGLKLDWDTYIPIDLHKRWAKFREEMMQLNKIRVPRYLQTKNAVISLHAFSDASERAYGAVLYIRSEDSNEEVKVTLLCSKSRVAPVRTVTLPRLELCAANLMAHLVSRVKTTLKIDIIRTYYWTDSQIVLAWIRSMSSSFHTFVSNRISSIQELTNISDWRYVNTKLNPADLVSRGIRPPELINSTTWFNGPAFLQRAETEWPCDVIVEPTNLPEERPQRTVLLSNDNSNHFLYSVNHGNSFNRLKRIVAYVLRAVNLFQKKIATTPKLLTVTELESAVNIIVKQMQKEEFQLEIAALTKKRPIDRKSKLINLAPFLDQQSIIRVGARLQGAELSYDAKHPIVLQSSHPFTKLLLIHLHEMNLHAGPQALQAISRQQFWILRAKQLASTIVHECIRCTRFNPKVFGQMMGNLPDNRVLPARPFVNVGIDFCGPVYTHYKIRGKKPTKTYICVFCCFSTKACHLEVVSDLSTDGFIAALKRFIARRGCCQNIYCDNATNFVGARNQLAELQSIIHDKQSQEDISHITSQRGIEFHFIPPRSPHFGGIWEAAVKSAKHLLQRSIASASLTYEELCTVTSEAEAVLNSRPISPLSNDPNDLTALTPGHFLIGEPLTSTINSQCCSTNPNLLTRWKLVQYIRNEFWRRWSIEYLCELQQRSKWKVGSNNVQPGMLVLIKDDNIPPLKWQLGRIESTIPGNDGIVRVADVRTQTGVFRRVIHKLCPLLMEKSDTKDAETPSVTEAVKQKRQSTKRHPNKGRFLPINSNWHQQLPKEKEGPTQKKRSRSASLLTIALIACCVLPVLSEPTSPITVEPFLQDPGIYFQTIGQVSLTSSEWNIITFYDMKQYWQELIGIRKSVSDMKEFCSTVIVQGTVCQQILLQFEHQLAQIEQTNKLFHNGGGGAEHSSRKRRSPLDIIGSVANKLFGVLDAEYANYLEGEIEKIRLNENHLQVLIRNQTSIMETTVNIFKRKEEHIEQQFRAISGQLTQLTHDISSNSQQQIFSTLCIRTMMAIHNYEQTQAALWNVLSDLHQGTINPLLLTPSQLHEQLALITKILPPTTSIPVSRTNEDISLYKLMTTRTRITKLYVIFQIKLPIIHADPFQLLHLTAVPIHQNNQSLILQTQPRKTPHGEIVLGNTRTEWDNILQRLSILQQQTIPEDLTKHHIHHYTLGYTITGILLVLATWWAIRKLRARGCKKQQLVLKPIPAQRTTIAEESFSFELGQFKEGENV